MNLSDVSRKRYDERLGSYIRQQGVTAMNMHQGHLDYAQRAAMAEMLDEQHTMLIAICDTLRLKGGWKS